MKKFIYKTKEVFNNFLQKGSRLSGDCLFINYIFYLTSLITIEAFCPPKPNEFDKAT